MILGTKRFAADLKRRLGRLGREHSRRRALASRPKWEQVIAAVESVRGEKWADFRDQYGDWGRELALYVGRKEAGLTLRELGSAVGGADYAAVGVAIQRFERRLIRNKVIRQAVAAVIKLLNVET